MFVFIFSRRFISRVFRFNIYFRNYSYYIFVNYLSIYVKYFYVHIYVTYKHIVKKFINALVDYAQHSELTFKCPYTTVSRNFQIL